MPKNEYPHYQVKKLLTPTQCAKLIEVTKELHAVDYDQEVDANGNGCRQIIHDIPEDNPRYSWLYDKVWTTVWAANAKWGFDIDGWQQPLRIAKYVPGYSHDWHMDYTKDDQSKIAMSVRLNGGYDGGIFQMLETDPIAPVAIGSGVFFPAFAGHRVTPVTEGERWVLLAWVAGPRFR